MSKRTIGIHQPNFLPYGGFFKKILHSDIFVILDTAQFSKNDWVNRNRIKSNTGALWITVPVKTSGKSNQLINEVETMDKVNWRQKHIRSYEQYYRKSPFFEPVIKVIADAYSLETNRLSEFNTNIILKFCKYLGIDTEIVLASNLNANGQSTERLVNICNELNGGKYLYGEGGKNYMDFELFEKAGIELELCDFHSPVYPQLGGEFEANLSVADIMFHLGEGSPDYLRSA